MKQNSNLEISTFLSDLSSSSPTPGGGGASALVGAVGIALGSMVGALTLNNPKYKSNALEVELLMKQAASIQKRLYDCIEKDAESFAPLANAYKIPKDDPYRLSVMEACLKTAATVPMEILHLCCEAIDLHAAFLEKGTFLALSDIATGVSFCLAALYGAAVNIKINTKYMKDRAHAESLNQEANSLIEPYREKAVQIFNSIYQGLC